MGALAGGPSEWRAKATGPLDTDALVGDRGLWEQPVGAPLAAVLPAWHPHPAGHMGSHTPLSRWKRSLDKAWGGG